MAPLDVVALPSMQRSRVRSINFYTADLEEAAGSQGPVPEGAEMVIDTDAEDPGAAMEAVRHNLGMERK